MSDLRCRPGDLAVVVKGMNSGLFVDVLRLNTRNVHPECEWVIKPHGEAKFNTPGPVYPWDEVVTEDWILQPIRPPAPENQTEVLDELVI